MHHASDPEGLNWYKMSNLTLNKKFWFLWFLRFEVAIEKLVLITLPPILNEKEKWILISLNGKKSYCR